MKTFILIKITKDLETNPMSFVAERSWERGSMLCFQTHGGTIHRVPMNRIAHVTERIVEMSDEEYQELNERLKKEREEEENGKD